MAVDDFAWRVEEACLNAWPSPRQVLGQGWLMRLSGGATRRTNSVNPLRAPFHDPRRILTTARTLYHLHGRRLIFRVPTIVTGIDAPLEQLGFVAEAKTCTFAADLGETVIETDMSVEVTDVPSAAWLAAKARITPSSDAQQRAYRAMIDSIACPKAFVALRRDSEIVSLAYGVLHDGLLVVESVATDSRHLRRGLARRTVGRLMGWARAQGIAHACLQVVADNAPAIALYRMLGFDRELYRYHYRSEVQRG